MSEQVDGMKFVPEKLSPKNCARCGGDHEGLRARSFARNPVIGGKTVWAWATCPTTEEPILMTVEPAIPEER